MAKDFAELANGLRGRGTPMLGPRTTLQPSHSRERPEREKHSERSWPPHGPR